MVHFDDSITNVNILNTCLKNISYHTIIPVHCYQLIIHAALVTIDQIHNGDIYGI